MALYVKPGDTKVEVSQDGKRVCVIEEQTFEPRPKEAVQVTEIVVKVTPGIRVIYGR